MMLTKKTVDPEKSWQILIRVFVLFVFLCLIVSHVTALLVGKKVAEPNEQIKSAAINENMYAVNVIAKNGTVSMEPAQDVYANGTRITIKPIAGNGYIFNSWSGDLMGRENPLVITVNGNMSLIAHFMEQISASERPVNNTATPHPEPKEMIAGI
ncbi:hypothetical protein JW960_11680 [candidate division KSB1 bacterium]|nr:hypothetical protein [candidate division KSB1 bacterium]